MAMRISLQEDTVKKKHELDESSVNINYDYRRAYQPAGSQSPGLFIRHVSRKPKSPFRKFEQATKRSSILLTPINKSQSSSPTVSPPPPSSSSNLLFPRRTPLDPNSINKSNNKNTYKMVNKFEDLVIACVDSNPFGKSNGLICYKKKYLFNLSDSCWNLFLLDLNENASDMNNLAPNGTSTEKDQTQINQAQNHNLNQISKTEIHLSNCEQKEIDSTQIHTPIDHSYTSIYSTKLNLHSSQSDLTMPEKRSTSKIEINIENGFDASERSRTDSAESQNCSLCSSCKLKIQNKEPIERQNIHHLEQEEREEHHEQPQEEQQQNQEQNSSSINNHISQKIIITSRKICSDSGNDSKQIENSVSLSNETNKDEKTKLNESPSAAPDVVEIGSETVGQFIDVLNAEDAALRKKVADGDFDTKLLRKLERLHSLRKKYIDYQKEKKELYKAPMEPAKEELPAFEQIETKVENKSPTINKLKSSSKVIQTLFIPNSANNNLNNNNQIETQISVEMKESKKIQFKKKTKYRSNKLNEDIIMKKESLPKLCASSLRDPSFSKELIDHPIIKANKYLQSI